MAQRSSRSSKNKSRKNPDLRTGGGRRAKAERSREREAAGSRDSASGPAVRVRPAGVGGVLLVQVLAWLGVAAIAALGIYLERWNLVSYPDSMWLYVAFGTLALAVAVGRIGRGAIDADAWGLLSLLVPLGLFIAEVVSGPECPTGGNCASIGARGSLGVALSVLLILVLAFASWALARWQQRAGADRRPAHGRIRYHIAAVTMVVLFVFPGLVLAASMIGTDIWLRSTPPLVQTAQEEVERECFGLLDAPALAVRAAPHGYNPAWTTFAVRRAGESRPAVGSKKSTSDWVGLDDVSPYEATVSFTSGGEAVQLDCRRIGPGTGNATKDDLKQDEPDSNPMSPKTIGASFLPRFFTQGVAGPTEEGKKLAAEQAKQAAAATKAKAAKDAKDGEKAASAK